MHLTSLLLIVEYCRVESGASSPDKRWAKLKARLGSNTAIEAVLQMTGLEAVKSNLLSILEIADLTKSQGADISQQRFFFFLNPFISHLVVLSICRL